MIGSVVGVYRYMFVYKKGLNCALGLTFAVKLRVKTYLAVCMSLDCCDGSEASSACGNSLYCMFIDEERNFCSGMTSNS